MLGDNHCTSCKLPLFFETSGDFTLIGIQLIAVLWIFSWVFIMMGFWYYMINFFGWLRVAREEEEAGMDISRHKGSAYDLKAPSEHEIERLQIRRESEKQLFIDSSTRSRSSRGSRHGRQNSTGKNSNDEEDGPKEETAKDEIADP